MQVESITSCNLLRQREIIDFQIVSEVKLELNHHLSCQTPALWSPEGHDGHDTF